MIKGSSIANGSSSTLQDAHDLDAVAWVKGGPRPGGARDDCSIESDRNPASAGVDRLFLQQRCEGHDGKPLVPAIDPDAGRHFGLRHGSLLHSAAARIEVAKRSIPNARIDVSMTPSRTNRAIASAVTGASRMPLRWCPVA